MMNNTGQSYWLFLHPYVYVSIKKGTAILYNSLNGTLLEFGDKKKPIVKLLEKLNSDTHLYVVKIKKEDIDQTLSGFIKQLRETYSGDMIDTAIRPHKPFQTKPVLSVHRTLDYLTIGEEKNKIPVNDKIKDYLSTLTLYINGECNQTCEMCQTAFKQLTCCRRNPHSTNEMGYEEIEKLLEETKNSSLQKLDITGGNISRHPGLIPMVNGLNSYPVSKVYHIHYLNLEDNPDFFNVFRAGGERNRLNITVHFPLNKAAIDSIFQLLHREAITSVKFDFVIESPDDLTQAEKIISTHEITNFEFCPYYNGTNLAFFKENIFINREAIVESKPDMNDIFARMLINSQEFKRLTVLNTKEIVANPNNPSIGKLGKGNLFDLIFKELHNGKSWTKVRKNVTPCKSCVFNALCPPISGYEYALGRYNLCNINE